MLTIVTAIYGPGFPLYDPADSWPDCRFVCFTDQDLNSKRWQIVRHDVGLTPRRSNRHIKALLHRFVKGPTLYIDAEFSLEADPNQVVAEALQRGSVAATRHPQRGCLFDEARYCIRKKYSDDPEAIELQVERYRADSMPEQFGLWAGGIIARRGDDESARLGEAWWAEIEQGSERDQVSLPFASWRTGVGIADIGGVYTALPWLSRRKR